MQTMVRAWMLAAVYLGDDLPHDADIATFPGCATAYILHLSTCSPTAVTLACLLRGVSSMDFFLLDHCRAVTPSILFYRQHNGKAAASAWRSNGMKIEEENQPRQYYGGSVQ